MKSHISFKWKSLDVISSQGKSRPFQDTQRKKNKAINKMETEAKQLQQKQNNYYVVNQFQANVPFLHPSKTAGTLLFFRSVLGVKKGNIGLKWFDNYFREIINIRNNATLITV